MSNGIVIVRLLGRFGNQCMQYAYARAYAESIGAEFRCDRWLGQRVFKLEDKPVGDPGPLTRRSELDVLPGETNVDFMGYAQNERAMLYTRAQLHTWFTFRQDILDTLRNALPHADDCCAHRRAGDYFGYGYPVVSEESYHLFARTFGIPKITWITEEDPTVVDGFDREMGFLPDFYRLMRCRILLRGNSSFSWLAGCLNPHGQIYSPIIDGLDGGKEHLCQFVAGNHPRFANLGYTRELHLKP